ncbi:rab guanine nucleotide exchange factor S2 [Ascosphaera aggregata]|nr:rab guanine nucleotide exchange factor S2 [Ascosphaera aggregata]
MNISSTHPTTFLSSSVAAAAAASNYYNDDDIVEPPPAPPTSYSHLVKPVCRQDIPAYDDYKSMLNIIRSLTDFRSSSSATPVNNSSNHLYSSSAAASSSSSTTTTTTNSAMPSIANRLASATSLYLGPDVNQSGNSAATTAAPSPATGNTSSAATVSSSAASIVSSPPSKPQSRSTSAHTLNRRVSMNNLSPYQHSATTAFPQSILSTSPATFTTSSPSILSRGTVFSSSSAAVIGNSGTAGTNIGSGLGSSSGSNNNNLRNDQGFSYTALKETRFYKRIIAEDIEPTLRLDLAPGISWLTRRSVLSSISDGALLIEPLSQSLLREKPACSMCGEKRRGRPRIQVEPPLPHHLQPQYSVGSVSRGDVIHDGKGSGSGTAMEEVEENPRTHAFRTSASDTAQRYPLCQICLEKMRACCEFVGYLRLIVDGHVHVRDSLEERDVWEEIVKLRERIFWARIGGGVVPAFVPFIQELRARQRMMEMELEMEMEEKQKQQQQQQDIEGGQANEKEKEKEKWKDTPDLIVKETRTRENSIDSSSVNDVNKRHSLQSQHDSPTATDASFTPVTGSTETLDTITTTSTDNDNSTKIDPARLEGKEEESKDSSTMNDADDVAAVKPDPAVSLAEKEQISVTAELEDHQIMDDAASQQQQQQQGQEQEQEQKEKENPAKTDLATSTEEVSLDEKKQDGGSNDIESSLAAASTSSSSSQPSTGSSLRGGSVYRRHHKALSSLSEHSEPPPEAEEESELTAVKPTRIERGD